MRITLITRACGPGSGTAGYAHRLAGALLTLGHEVTIVPPKTPTRGYRLALERILHADLLRLGGGWHIDAMRAVGRRPGLRTPLLDRLAVHTAKIVVVNSRMVQRDLRARGIRSAVVRTGVDRERFPLRDPSRASDALLFVGHGWRRKNFRTAVLAAARIPHRPLWIAGRDGARRRRLRWARHILGSRAVDLGPSIDTAAVLPQVAAVLHPTLYDPASNLVLEAMAAGVPVITSARDGSAELLPSTLVLRDPHDHAELARRVMRALEDGPRLGQALHRVASRWPDDRNAAELVRLLESLCYESETSCTKT